MFDQHLIDDVRRTLPEFSLGPSGNTASITSDAIQAYLEYYGLLEILKDLEVDHFFGYQTCLCGGASTRIATHYWKTPQSKGTVFVVHGLFDHVGLFQALISYLLRQQFSVVAIDLPGHGLSDGQPTVIQSFFDYAEVVESTLERIHADEPAANWYGVGQSTGAAVLMAQCFARHQQGKNLHFARLAFLGPLVRPRQWPWGRVAYRYLGRYLKRLARDFTIPNSHSEEFHNFLRFHDPMQHRWLSMEWVGALNSWVDNMDSQPVIETPLLVIQGTADRVVDWHYNVPVIQQHFANTQVNYIEGAMHHLVNEVEAWRKTVFTSTAQFFRNRSATTATTLKDTQIPQNG